MVKRKDFNATLKQLTDCLERMCSGSRFHSDGAAYQANTGLPVFGGLQILYVENPRSSSLIDTADDCVYILCNVLYCLLLSSCTCDTPLLQFHLYLASINV